MIKHQFYFKFRLSNGFRANWGEFRLSLLWLLRTLANFSGLQKTYQTLLIYLVKKTCLFDSLNYLEFNQDVANHGIDPLRHYVIYGDREGRWPMPLFDPCFYRSRVGGRTITINSLLHYALVGRYRCVSPSAWFDMHHYLTLNKDIARSGLDPLLHYLQQGGIEGRSPNPQFDGAYYLAQYADVRHSRMNPLLHYIHYGQQEGRESRSINIESTTAQPFVVPSVPNDTDWETLEHCFKPSVTGSPVIDVIVPVYGNRALTWLCLASVLTARNKTSFELIVINDASPEPEIHADLIEMEKRGWITLIENRKNLGFIGTVNKGIGLHPDRDIILLNSDTEVFPCWIDRLNRAAYHRERVASVTPLSNNATICSYPRFLHDNPYPLETDYLTLDRLTSETNANVTVETPTGVGFCMYMRRTAIEQIGIFDHIAFGKGYGEENDWCQRAISNGWVNLITADTFVRHFGSASFQGERAKRATDALKVLAKKYPDYEKQVQHFIASDPLSEARHRLDWARLKQHVKPKNTLLVCHNRNGGAEKHLQEDAARLKKEGHGVFLMRPVRGEKKFIRIQHHTCRQLLNMYHYRMSDITTLSRVMAELGITVIHSHGLVDFEAGAADYLLQLCKKNNIDFQVDIHDYKVICPRINLIDKYNIYCTEPGVTECNLCLNELGNDFGVTDITKWRKMHHRVLRGATKIWVPDEDVSNRLHTYYPDIEFEVAAHEALPHSRQHLSFPIALKPKERLRIVVIGAIGKIKGYDVLLSCVKDARQRKLPLEFVIMGYTMNDAPLKKLGIHITGKYHDYNALDLLTKLAPHIVWLPSTWPETYSYTLSIALRYNALIAAFDIGAIAKRIRDQGSGMLLPIDNSKKPHVINNEFIFLTEKENSKYLL